MIHPPSSPKPKPPTFVQAAEAFVASKLATWVADLKGSPSEPAALAYARRESWILPTEGLECVTALNLFPGVDCTASSQAIAQGEFTELEAKKRIAAAVLDGFREANAGINAIRFPAPPGGRWSDFGHRGQEEGHGCRPGASNRPVEPYMWHRGGRCRTPKLTPLPPSVRLSAKRTIEYEQSIEREEASGSCGCSALFGETLGVVGCEGQDLQVRLSIAAVRHHLLCR